MSVKFFIGGAVVGAIVAYARVSAGRKMAQS